MTAVRVLRFALPPAQAVYAAGDGGRLAEDLEASRRATLVEPIRELSQLWLDPQGRMGPRSREVVADALSQLCTSVSRGLADLVFDLSGMRARAGTVDHAGAYSAAAQVFNAVVGLRFFDPGGPHNGMLVVDVERNRVEGAVGPGYKFFFNAEAFEKACEAAGRCGFEFAGAWMLGRRLEALFAGPELSDGYSLGVRVVNSETGGPALTAEGVVRLGEGVARIPKFRNSMRHAGGHVRRRAGQVFSAFDSLPPPGDVLESLGRLAGQPFADDPDPAKRKRAVNRTVDALSSRGLNRGEALSAAAAALREPSASHLSVFANLLRLQDPIDSAARDRLSKAAGTLLIGNVTSSKGKVA